MDVFITNTGHFLPGNPINNDEIESILGKINNKPSRLKKKILKSNGIKNRHYAIDPTGKTFISNTEMAAQAGLDCLASSGIHKNSIDMLSCATSQSDLVLPGFASMVQAEMKIPDVEIHSCHGICSSGMMAIKAAYTALKCGEHDRALVVASELASRLFKASRYEAVERVQPVDFDAEFLRWMLSDGAGAMFLQGASAAKKHKGIKLKIEWIRGYSHADAYPVCMSIGSNKKFTKHWQDYATYEEAEKAGAIVLRQDVRLLDEVVKCGVDGFLRLVQDKKVIPSEVDYVLCHYSSDYFKSKIFEMLDRAGVAIPEHKWFTNLYEKGNTGCASIFIILDEFIRKKNLKSGEKIMCMVPESGRFNSVYMLLTVVEFD